MRTDLVLALSALVFAGCDYADHRSWDRERSDSIYREAMAEYSAGHIDKAVSGLERVVAATPANASARFQLACLLQDTKKDYLGAICHYREFIALDRSGAKSGLAAERMAQCERLLGPQLVNKFGDGQTESLSEANAGLRERVAALEKTNADLEKRLTRAMARANESAEEVERMRKLLRGESTEDKSRVKVESEAALLDDEEDDGKEDRIRMSKDVGSLVLESDQEQVTTPFAVAEKKPVEAKKKVEEPEHEERPAEYIVQDGDTLYKLAIRFYGRRAAWTKIREANKAVISTDGRIKTGQKLVLP